MQRTIILCPYYNDEASFNIFAAKVEAEVGPLKGQQFQFLVVNDGAAPPKLESTLPTTVIHLHRNLGHQKAIAVGLAYANAHLSYDQVIVMDCDGEDQPEDIGRLLREQQKHNSIITASRASRQEGRGFRFFYQLYKLMFYVLTGQKISFGNFMLLPANEVNNLVYYSEIWNHLAGAVIKSKKPFHTARVHRGRRYAGKSQMNFTGLLLHGLGAIGVFIEVIASRLLMVSLSLIALSVLAIVVIISIKLLTDKAIPGWATSALSSMLVVLLQSCLLSLFTIFLYLTFQGQRKFIPAHHYMDYVRTIENPTHE